MISVNNICVSFSGNDLFKNISFVINKKDRIGLVGKNGVGKSTLMKIIAGTQKPESGIITLPDGETIGYLPQEIKTNSTKTILDEVLTVFEAVQRLEKEIEDIGKELETRTDYESDSYSQLIEQLTDKHEQLNIAGGGKAEGEAEKILKGLGFDPEEFSKSVSAFSGGWQMRIELAKLLLKSPTLLLLDEPTNHLDIASIIWLEETFRNYPGAIMMVSHDRMFLDNITNRTIEIVFGKTYDYKVAYTKYFELREERLEQQRAAYNNQQSYIAQQERFIERFKSKASKAKQAQSKMKQLDKIERIDFDELDTSTIQFNFPEAPRSGNLSVGAKSVSKNYGKKQVFSDATFDIMRGDKVAFVGQNGQGKTTMVKLINKTESFDGELTIGHNVDVGYYAQVQEGTLNQEITVLETIENEATGENAKIHKVRGLLGAFLFGPEDVDKKVKVLSGGEKSRLALAKLLLQPYNLLILDEPTNHLDLASKEVLKNALKSYNGTLILVSHDRDFLQGLTDRTFEFKGGTVKEHIGEIDAFLEYHKTETFRDFELSGKQAPSAKQPKTAKQNDFADKKSQEKEKKKLQNALSNCEKKISDFETKIAEFDEQLSDPEKYQELMNDGTSFSKYEDWKKQLENEMENWERIAEELDAISD